MDVRLDLNVPPRTLAAPSRPPVRRLRPARKRIVAVVAGQRARAHAPDGRVHARRAVRVALGAREDAGEALGHQRPQERQAGADDAHVGFDRGPCCRGGVVVGLVRAVGDGDEGLETQDRDDAYAGWGSVE